VTLKAEAMPMKAVQHLRFYPQPPDTDIFVADTDARAMWNQYQAYIEGRDRLLPMAYSCLPHLEFRARSHPIKGNERQKAASMYCIDYEVLNKLGNSSTTWVMRWGLVS
jgi:hypothetical protein